MCRSTHYQSHSHGLGDANPFTITAFFVRLWGSGFELNPYESASKPCPIIDSLPLLLHLPLSGNSNNALEIDGSTGKIPPYSSATLSLRRLQLANDPSTDEHTQGDAIFGSKQRVRVTTQMLSFQLYVGEAKLLKGAISRDDHHHHIWKLGCCSCEPPSSFLVSEVELWVALDRHGHVAISERVAIPTHPKRPMVVKKHKMRTNKLKLEDIPEETELRMDTDADANDPELEEAGIHLEMDLEVLRRALDMGIWVLCLGLGYMVSRASGTNFRPPPTFS